MSESFYEKVSVLGLPGLGNQWCPVIRPFLMQNLSVWKLEMVPELFIAVTIACIQHVTVYKFLQINPLISFYFYLMCLH